ncbi:hypothetical protein Lal_00002411 [Lupinus albus]|nr:hypothetical protein Lal_00002411 [Lupinus albus]
MGQWSSSMIGSRSSLVNQFAWVRDLDLFGSKDFNSWRWFRDGLSRRIGDESNTRIITQPDQLQNLTNHQHHFIWKSKAPLKVLSFAWRLFQDRIPTMYALVKRGVHFLNESASLLALPLVPIHHFSSFLGLAKNRKCWKLWNVIWLATIWALWLARNDIVFNNAQPSIHKILNSSKVNSWLWVKAQHGKDNILFTDWNTNSLACLNSTL